MPEALSDPSSLPVYSSSSTTTSSSSYGGGTTHHQFDSPDNDSAFSSESQISSEIYGSQQSPPAYQASETPEIVAPRRTLYVKIFCGDGSTKSVMINEGMSMAYILRILVEKNHVQPDPSWGIVEQIPELYLERCYEDHECLLENLLDWRADSPNKILFLSRPEKYDLFRRPERYLVSTPSYGEPSVAKSGCTGGGGSGKDFHPGGCSLNTTWDQLSRQNLLQEFFSRSGEDYYPEIEGMLWLKAEGKKSWKKNYFALRADGIYQRGGKLLASVDEHQVYKAIGWKKKFKAPNDWGFALKDPRVQVKDETRHIKYLCAESESALLKWLTGLRIIKNKDYLLDNYQNQLAEMTTGHCIARENRVVIAINKEEPPPVGRRNPQPPPRSIHSNQQHLHRPSSNEMVYSPSSTTSSSNSSERDLNAAHLSSSNEFLLAQAALQQKQQMSTESLSSSGCVSESSSLSENAGFELDVHNGGTIRRKPLKTHVTRPVIVSAVPPNQEPLPDPPTPTVAEEDDEEDFILPPPPMQDISLSGRFDKEEQGRCRISHSPSNSSLPPPPPSEMTDGGRTYYAQGRSYEPSNYPREEGIGSGGEIREELYPCGVVRCLFPNRNSGISGDIPKKNQMDLLKRLPNQLPPPPAPNYNPPILKAPTQTRKKRITFNEMVEHFNPDTSESQLTPLKDNEDPFYKVPSASVRNPNPGKLFADNHVLKGTPPREFLVDLQRVMYKKWTLSQKIRPEDDEQLRGEPGFSNYNENAVSHWILHSLKHCQISGQEEESILPEEDALPPPPSSLLSPLPGAYPRAAPFSHPRSVPNTFPPRPEDRPFLLCQMRAQHQGPQKPTTAMNGLYYSHGGPNSYTLPKMQ